jgi:hypothetical protein
MEATQGVGWVLILTLVLLYACAVVFTSLIGHGLIYEGEVPQAAREVFGTVPQSMFMLFKLMNDDQSVVEHLVDSTTVKLAFAVFMVMSNWMVLAVLTSVVSDKMISSTQQHEAEIKAKHKSNEKLDKLRKLDVLFKEFAVDGQITVEGFGKLLDDHIFIEEVTQASGLEKTDIEEIFFYSCRKDRVDYAEFLLFLLEHGAATTELSMVRMQRNLSLAQDNMEAQMAAIMRALNVSEAQSPTNMNMRSIRSDFAGRRVKSQISSSQTLEN